VSLIALHHAYVQPVVTFVCNFGTWWSAVSSGRSSEIARLPRAPSALSFLVSAFVPAVLYLLLQLDERWLFEGLNTHTWAVAAVATYVAECGYQLHRHVQTHCGGWIKAVVQPTGQKLLRLARRARAVVPAMVSATRRGSLNCFRSRRGR